MLVERGDRVRGLIRNPDQADDLREVGIEPVVCDLEGDDDVAAAVSGADAVVFAAGAGPGSGAERKRTMDLDGAVKLIEAARADGIRRYLIVSSMGAGNPPAEGGDVFGEYLRAKAGADRALQRERPRLHDRQAREPHRRSADRPGRDRRATSTRGEVPRADVAATLAAALRAENTIGKTFELRSGDTPIEEAVAGLG